MNILAVVLARAGSEGLPSKHLQLLLGRQVIDYTLDHAMASSHITHAVVSTDCAGVKRAARCCGLTVIDRPAELATATASVQDVMLHAMEIAEENEKFTADALVVLYGNVPLRPLGLIDDAIELLQKTGADSVRSFCPVGKWHPQWMSRLNGDRVEACATGSIDRRQNLEPLFLHDGGVVAVSRAAMLRGRENPADPHAFFGKDRRGLQTEPGSVVEIDHVRDLYIAEAILRERRDSQRTFAAKVA